MCVIKENVVEIPSNDLSKDQVQRFNILLYFLLYVTPFKIRYFLVTEEVSISPFDHKGNGPIIPMPST